MLRFTSIHPMAWSWISTGPVQGRPRIHVPVAPGVSLARQEIARLIPDAVFLCFLGFWLCRPG